MEQNSQNSVKVTYEIVDPKVNETTIKIVNAYREEEKKSPIDNILPIYANPDDAGADVLAAFVDFCFFAGWAAVCDAAVKEDARPFTALVFGT